MNNVQSTRIETMASLECKAYKNPPNVTKSQLMRKETKPAGDG